jgi:osmotically-inducible protein OsmY
MSRLLVIAIAAALSTTCGTATSSRDPRRDAAAHETVVGGPTISVPENAADREIRRHLNLAISTDDGLKSRDISFIVANGDVSVTGTVRTEEERKKVNELAMSIGGVKSVANGLSITE